MQIYIEQPGNGRSYWITSPQGFEDRDKQRQSGGNSTAFAGTPRAANRFLKRVRDFEQFVYDGKIPDETATKSLVTLEVDKIKLAVQFGVTDVSLWRIGIYPHAEATFIWISSNYFN